MVHWCRHVYIVQHKKTKNLLNLWCLCVQGVDSLGAYLHARALICVWYWLQDMSSKKDTSTVLLANRENTTAKSPLTSHRHYNAVNTYRLWVINYTSTWYLSWTFINRWHYTMTKQVFRVTPFYLICATNRMTWCTFSMCGVCVRVCSLVITKCTCTSHNIYKWEKSIWP